jgi:hypothetical protein
MNRKEESELKSKAKQLLLEDLKESIREVEETDEVYESDETEKRYNEGVKRIIAIKKLFELEEIACNTATIYNDLQNINTFGIELEKIAKGINMLEKINGALNNIVDCICSKELLDAIKGKEY